MKWTREEAGQYSCGQYSITGQGVKWELFFKEESLGKFKGKKLAQQAAEEHRKGDREPTEENTPTPAASTTNENDMVQLNHHIPSLLLEIVELRSDIKKLTELLEEELDFDDEDEDEDD